jgi:hypothetical protein
MGNSVTTQKQPQKKEIRINKEAIKREVKIQVEEEEMKIENEHEDWYDE